MTSHSTYRAPGSGTHRVRPGAAIAPWQVRLAALALGGLLVTLINVLGATVLR